MLTHEQNELLVRVGKDTPMGDFMRLYWFPFLPAADVVADGQPKNVRLLGENLLVFRDSDGKVALVDNACPHRGAPLIYGRNEECGLRCAYHGWKFDVEGRLIDTPAEPPQSRLKQTVRLKAYPCVERNGILWAYMGPSSDSPPPLPNQEWNLVAPEQVHVSFRVQECNWLQALEGDVDSAHGTFLHGRIDGEGRMKHVLYVQDRQPQLEALRREHGLNIAARRVLPDDTIYWRVTQFVFPFYTITPPQSKFPEVSGHAWVPIDDEHTLAIMFSYHPNEPLHPKTRQVFEEGYKGRETGHPSRSAFRHDNPADPFFGYWTKFGRENLYHLDYETQLKTWSSGIPGLWPQDVACQAGLGPVFDRTRERLGTSDIGVAMTRQVLLEAVAAHRDSGTIPASVGDPDIGMVRPVSIRMKPEQAWEDLAEEPMKAKLGQGFGYEP